MLKELRIQQIILIDQAELKFSKGFNVLSGETGSGKSAILHALALIAGARSNPSLIRHGQEKGTVEALFDIDHFPIIQTILDEFGINHEVSEYLCIKREIQTNGKHRCWINQQPVQTTALKALGEKLISICGQHAYHQLFQPNKHIEILDFFGDYLSLLDEFKASWQEFNAQELQLKRLKSEESQRLRDLDRFQFELEEIELAAPKEAEEEELFQEYTLLVNAEERIQHTTEILSLLSHERQGAIPALIRAKNALENLSSVDNTLDDSQEALEKALVEVQEILYTLERYQTKIEENPERLAKINDRLTLLSRLKKKYGQDLSVVLAYAEELRKKISLLNSAEEQIEKLVHSLDLIQKENDRLSAALTEKRKETAHRFADAITNQIRQLNMPKAVFSVQIDPKERTALGNDHIEFYLAPNVGENRISLKECASGGELSRVMLSIQSLLSGKSGVSSIIFDEIDANTGGKTAAIVGKILQEIGRSHQVIAITHFPQVASQADTHFQISKAEQEGRTLTQVKSLTDSERKKELKRMLGDISEEKPQ